MKIFLFYLIDYSFLKLVDFQLLWILNIFRVLFLFHLFNFLWDLIFKTSKFSVELITIWFYYLDWVVYLLFPFFGHFKKLINQFYTVIFYFLKSFIGHFCYFLYVLFQLLKSYLKIWYLIWYLSTSYFKFLIGFFLEISYEFTCLI